ncbi:efflux RND transporter permease subunit [Pseudoroseicyclus tamaricis]|uniref:Efflux RND transporter permease subunit n=1 Tax=Pseudoroseicyclus tamaricis TaxID=2705421 RepID=A0A6B2JSF1_9RHOB|nr:efflux RND transporter permease subunit [Pseudoroseicyclus tamaricis]NDU99508.1 efflux RND transporter permease subunit [Pseudoroseicyclus tamaricis]
MFTYFTRHRTAANLVMVLMIVAGVFAFPRMRAQFFPDVIIDSISVSVSWSGAGAEDVDAAIVQSLEPALRSVSGVTGSDARSSEGRASIRLEFEPGADMDAAEKEVSEAASSVSMPEGADEPQVRRGGWAERVASAIITGPVGIEPLAEFADDYVARLFEEGVTQTSISGIAAPSILVEVPSLSLIQHDIGLSDISAAIAREVTADPAGDAGAQRLRTGEARRSASEIAGIVLQQAPDGTTLTIGDVADVQTLPINRDRALYVGDNPAVQIDISRSAQGDAIAIEESAREVAAQLEATLPAGTSIDLVNSTAKEITARLSLLLDNGAMGLGLVLVLLFLFLNARTALWVALGLPVSMLAAIGVMYAFGLTLNIMSLFALIITLGIVVDDAIVVGEHADFRATRLGEPPKVAAENAARRMFLPVFSATLTTIIAFYGLVLIGGRFGDLISDIPFTVIAVLAASLVECFVILPNHLSHGLASAGKSHWYDWPSRQVDRGMRFVQERLFRPLVRLVILARYPVVALALLMLAWQGAMLIRGDVQWRFFSSPEQGTVGGNFAMLPGATREDSLEQMHEMQRAAAELGAEYEETYGVNPINYVIAQIGGNNGRPLSGAEDKESYQLGAITIELVDADLRPFSSGQFTSDLQQRTRALPMAETVSFRSWGTGPGGDAISVELSGGTPEILKEAAEALKAELSQFPEVSGPEDSLAYDKEELILSLTAQGRALGFTIDQLGSTLRQRLGGLEAATFPDGPRSASIRVELPEEELTADFLDRTMMRAEDGTYLPLADIVTVSQRTGFSSVRRINGTMLISVTAGLDDEDADRAAEIMSQIEGDILPRLEQVHHIDTEMSGLSEQEQEFLNGARLGTMVCLLAIYLVLSWIFSSWARPLIVMSIIPFGLIGAVLGHAAWGMPLSMFSMVGLIGMIGIIINDSIVLVSTIDEYSEKRGLVPAIVDGVADRLRPVFLTTATTVLGLAPLLYEGSAQAEFLKPTVITLVYGLAFGTVLVLLVVPALLAIQADIARLFASARKALRAPARGAQVPALLAVAVAAALFTLIVLPELWPAAPWATVPEGWPVLGVFALALAAALALLYAGTWAILRRRRAAVPAE